MEKYLKKAEELKGVTLGTVWGPSTVTGVSKNHVFLNENGEDYHVTVADWKEILKENNIEV